MVQVRKSSIKCVFLLFFNLIFSCLPHDMLFSVVSYWLVVCSMLVFLRQHEVAAEVTLCAYVQVADNATLYGVCLIVQEIVQRPPAILGPASPISQSPGGLGRFLVAAPRCYCILTRVPFFELHYEMLNRLALFFWVVVD